MNSFFDRRSFLKTCAGVAGASTLAGFRATPGLQVADGPVGLEPKVLAFTLSAVLAGCIGALSAHVINTWNARQGTFDASISYLAFVLVGGSRTFAGPVAGGMLLTLLPEALRALAGIAGLPDWLAQFLKDGRIIIYGFLIVMGAINFPQGLLTPRGRSLLVSTKLVDNAV